jgi:hypothetical protein
MSEKSVGYARLVQACRQPGCPICRCVRDESHGRLDALLYEHVTDPESRRTLRQAWGFCNWHTWMLLEVDAGRFGPSILYEDLLRQACDSLATVDVTARPSRFRAWLAGIGRRTPRSRIVERHAQRSACRLCADAAAAERHHLVTLVRFIDDADLHAAYVSADAVCVPHLVRAIELTSGSPALARLIEHTREKWAKVRRDLQSFIEKHDYRNAAGYTEAEAASYTRAFEILAGARGLFGNDLAAGRRGETSPPGRTG